MKLIYYLLPVVMVIYAISVSYSSAEELEESDLLLKSDEEPIDVARRAPPLLAAAGAKMVVQHVSKGGHKKHKHGHGHHGHKKHKHGEHHGHGKHGKHSGSSESSEEKRRHH